MGKREQKLLQNVSLKESYVPSKSSVIKVILRLVKIYLNPTSKLSSDSDSIFYHVSLIKFLNFEVWGKGCPPIKLL